MKSHRAAHRRASCSTCTHTHKCYGRQLCTAATGALSHTRVRRTPSRHQRAAVPADLQASQHTAGHVRTRSTCTCCALAPGDATRMRWPTAGSSITVSACSFLSCRQSREHARMSLLDSASHSLSPARSPRIRWLHRARRRDRLLDALGVPIIDPRAKELREGEDASGGGGGRDGDR